MKKLLCGAALLTFLVPSVLAGVVDAQTPSTVVTVGQTKAGCRFQVPWVGIDTTDVEWSGTCVGDVVSGTGTLRAFHDGKEVFSFEGTMHDGSPIGPGVLRLSDGMTLAGDVGPDGLKNGPALISPGTGIHYDGEVAQGLPDGRGAMTYADGSHYEGEWRAGRREGLGIQVWANGNRYEGGWQAGQQAGHGVMQFANGGRSEGDWAGSRLSGHGLQVFPSGSRYEGGFLNGRRNGPGTLWLPNGDRLEGDWKNDLLDGQGSYLMSREGRFDGEFHAGLPNGRGVAVSADGRRRYEGMWREGLPEGEGTLTQAGEAPFVGTWVRGCFSSNGRHAEFGLQPLSCPLN